MSVNEELKNKLSTLTPVQRQEIEAEIDILLIDDSESDDKSARLRHTVYEKYKKDIANLIAELEVHAHTLPRWIDGHLDAIFRILAKASSSKAEEECCKYYNMILLQEEFLLYAMKVELINLYVSEAKRYKQEMKKFNHSGVKPSNGRSVVSDIQSYLKDAIECEKIARKRIDSMFCDGANNLIELRAPGVEKKEIEAVEKGYMKAKTARNLCETYYPEVVNNGYTSTPIRNFVRKLPAIISFALAILGIISILK